MKLKKEIAEVTADAAKVTFPTPNHKWECFWADWRHVVCANLHRWTHITRDEINFCRYEQTASFRVTMLVEFGGFRSSVSRVFVVDPKADTASEIERVNAELSAWSKAVHSQVGKVAV